MVAAVRMAAAAAGNRFRSAVKPTKLGSIFHDNEVGGSAPLAFSFFPAIPREAAR